MKIKKLGFITFRFSCEEIDIITDPLLSEEAGVTIGKTTGEVVLFTGEKYIGSHSVIEDSGYKKIEKKKRESLHEITSPGEYELGGVLIRRPQGADFYILDEKDVRVVYVGEISKSIAVEQFAALGDVDLLILPVGDAEVFPNFDKLEKIISKVDPTYMIPCGYKESGLKGDFASLKGVDEFIKQFGYTHVTNDNKFVLSSGTEQESKVIEIVVLD